MISTQYRTSILLFLTILCTILVIVVPPVFASESAASVETTTQHAWWFYPLILLVLSFVLGVFAVLAGVGGGVLYVPIVSGFLPFHPGFCKRSRFDRSSCRCACSWSRAY